MTQIYIYISSQLCWELFLLELLEHAENQFMGPDLQGDDFFYEEERMYVDVYSSRTDRKSEPGQRRTDHVLPAFLYVAVQRALHLNSAS